MYILTHLYSASDKHIQVYLIKLIHLNENLFVITLGVVYLVDLNFIF